MNAAAPQPDGLTAAAARPLRIAMWSGPRNISTAMMRAWEHRPDCVVSDEPLYAAWLASSGAAHPGREEIVAAGQTDWRAVVATLTGPVPGGHAIWYQKHMCHHLSDDIEFAWTDALVNIFLIRRPDEVIASYIQARGTDRITAQDVGLPRQLELFEWIRARQGATPLVIDSGEFLQAPEAHLRGLCAQLGVEFLPAMLSWPAGPRDSDGVWAKHWYASVWRSTGFAAPRARDIKLTGRAAQVARDCEPLYEALHAHSLRI